MEIFCGPKMEIYGYGWPLDRTEWFNGLVASEGLQPRSYDAAMNWVTQIDGEALCILLVINQDASRYIKDIYRYSLFVFFACA